MNLAKDPTSSIPEAKTYFEKWDIQNKINEAKTVMENNPALNNYKNCDKTRFDRYFERLEQAIRSSFND